ncbi:MAG: TasA family protein [Aeromicrobium sp.]|uniref:TasA family protein n=1 Tax=Aeromicrobium sp. TaxID=1871063 RepID=UPI00260FF8A3|nr:TasA family protein [Aeromicrobium sp.]MDF1705985.1 TasA family protein [Aeromicrobium sp.]
MKNSRKILVPLATLAAAGAIAIGSGATFTSTTANTISSVTSGTLTHTNSKDDAAIFTLTDLKPGDTLTGSLTLKNTGSLPAAFSLTEQSSTNGFTGSNLSLTITNATTGSVVYTGTFGGLEDGVKKDIGQIAPDASSTFDFTVKLAQGADNADQGKNATATYTWDSVQLEGSTYTQ